MAEWPNASVLKTESPLRVTGVRIPPLPIMNDLIQKISYWQDDFPEEALAHIIDKEDEAKPHLRSIVRSTIEHYKELPEDYVGHIFALYLLAQFRDSASFEDTLNVLKLPEPYPRALLHDLLYQSYPQVIASCYGGNPEPLFAVIKDTSLSYVNRVVALVAATILVNRKALPRDILATFLKTLLNTDDPAFLASLAQEVAEMHLGELYDPIKSLYTAKKIDEESFSEKHFDTIIQSDYTNPNKFFLIDDIFEDLNGKEYSGE